MAIFKARARTLEMLGKQQIAGIPTAISELFKNAHDAYADNAVIDYYRSDGLFVLRDDGLGMTLQDFEERWLTIGTESKLGMSKGLSSPPRDPKKLPRPVLGEKGVGRLAIASIGPQVLILTRAKRENKLHDLVVSFINWELFGLPGIDLNQIIIPLRSFPGGTLPDKNDIKEMLKEQIININSLVSKEKISEENAEAVIKNINQFVIDPTELNNVLGEPSLFGEGHGTHFIILPSDEIIKSEIDDDDDQRSTPALIKNLLGFSNTMTPGHPEPVITVKFIDHKIDGKYPNIINSDNFFTPEDFTKADHQIQGQFDKYGKFNGSVTIYGKEKHEYEIPSPLGENIETDCGKFTINISYIQGRQSESLLSSEDFEIMSRKLNKIGGIYIYKNGIRILPYGNSDYDFLDMERRRSLHAGEYFFSYRRLFGVIELSNTNNKLKEKAGREGFIENKAYKQFKDICKNLFVQIANDLFGENAKSNYQNTKEETNRANKARKEAAKRSRTKKNSFEKRLNTYINKITKKEPDNRVKSILDSTDKEFKSLINNIGLAENTNLLTDLESVARKKIDDLRHEYKLERPVGFAIDKSLQSDWDYYQNEYSKIENNLFIPALESIEKMANEAARLSNAKIDRIQKLKKVLEDSSKYIRTKITYDSKESSNLIKNINNKLVSTEEDAFTDINYNINLIIRDYTYDNKILEDDTLSTKNLVKFESNVLKKIEANAKLIEKIKDQLESVKIEPDENGEIISINDIIEAYENELYILKEKADIDFELSQMGLAINIIHHEFNQSIKAIKQDISSLKLWADLNSDLNPLYNDLAASFDHLDGYLTMLTPLNKRMYNKPVDIKGNAIRRYIQKVFEKRIKQENIDIISKPAFDNKIIIGYPSAFYPVFLNVIDNAFYWLKNSKSPRIIMLDADKNGFSISNNGPAINLRDREVIFDQGFSRKPNGRGLGLYISKQVLNKVGYNIYVSEPIENMNVTFRVESVNI